MKILLCYATAGEGKIIKEQIKNLNLKINLDITYLCTGMGMYETIFNLTKALNSQNFDTVLNIGVCGYLDGKKDWIQIGRTVNMSTGKELIVPIGMELASIESIGCSQVPVTSHPECNEGSRRIVNKNLDSSPTPLLVLGSEGQEKLNYFDMESWAIEYVCDKFRIPRVILKVPVDKIGEEEFDREKAGKMLRENLDYEMIIKKLMN